MLKNKIYIIITIVFLTYHLTLAKTREVNDKSKFNTQEKKNSIIGTNYKDINDFNSVNNEEVILKKRNLQTVIISNFTTSYIVYISIIAGLEILNVTMLLILCCRNYFLNTDYCWVTMCYLFIPLIAWIFVIFIKRWFYPNPQNDQNCVNINSGHVFATNFNNRNLNNNLNNMNEMSNLNINHHAYNQNYQGNQNNNNFNAQDNRNLNYNNPYNNDVVNYNNNYVNPNNNNINKYSKKDSHIDEPGK